ncbi:hypothetical protein SADUNF_Sadunf01G0114000 [Salix dunnii]|uniref:Reverse transcriptase Ty1/copia-type domain-containing protein n=1 Tax=Salix dunnii TaxID=1413687 RepID=A0A835NBA2_9ROSI|nr:hypothetical protein SADUNF_Sadunf01G0114000 [Salix dunnii]
MSLDPSAAIFASPQELNAKLMVLILTRNDQEFVAHFVLQLGTQFSLKDLGSLIFLLGIEVVPTFIGIFLSQHKYIWDLLNNTHMDAAKDVSTPLSTSQSLRLVDVTDSMDATGYQSLIRSLHIKRNTTLSLTTFSDSEWAGNIDDRLSTSDYIIFLSCNPISWKLNKQRVVVRSSTETEYRALANGASETLLLLALLQELGFSLKQSPTLFCDNIGATHLGFNLVHHSRMKHIQIDLHFVCDHVQKGTFTVHHVHTHDQLADLLTKPLSHECTDFLRDKIGLADGSPFLRGRIKEGDLIQS